MTSRVILADIREIAERLSRTQHRMASGRQIEVPSDDPFGTSRALSLRSDLDQNVQHQRNVQEAFAWQEVTDLALDRVGQYVLRARELVLQAGNDTTTQEGKDAIANEIRQIIDAIKTEANAQYAGRYVFAGTATTTRPYAVGGSDAFSGNTSSVTREIGPGIQVPINTIGSSVIGDDTTGLLSTLRTIVTDLGSGNGAALRGADLQALDAAHDLVLETRSVVGALANRLDVAAERLVQVEETSRRLLSETEDADMAETMVQFSTQQAAYQAALKAGANIVQSSLLDFLR
jgi:flagellar hook-associated protein 3 FlgL